MVVSRKIQKKLTCQESILAEGWQSCSILKINARSWMWDIRVKPSCWCAVPTCLYLTSSDYPWHFSEKRHSPSIQINVSLLLYNIGLYNILLKGWKVLKTRYRTGFPIHFQFFKLKCSVTQKSGCIHLQFNGKEILFFFYFFNLEDDSCIDVIEVARGPYQENIVPVPIL